MPPQSNPDDPTVTIDPSPTGKELKTETSKPSMIGTMVGGRYLIEQELGRGGIGAVYLARDKPELMSRRVVVKVLLEDSLKNEWVVQKFHQEIESLTRLDDPGVVGVFDAGKLEDGSPYLVMQYVDGVSLRTEIKQGGMDLLRAANIMRQIGKTLHTAHAEGIIHRDLKPENIMLRRVTSGDEQVKVIDFGIAKVKNSVVAPSTVTGAGVAGTIGYMSPEQLQAQTITPASDIYALGAIAYEMLTGTRPFNPETGFQLLEMQREGVRVRPRDLRPAIPDRAQEVILKALEFDPKRRFQSASEFGAALADSLLGEANTLEATTADFVIPEPEKRINTESSAAAAGSAVVLESPGQRRAMELAHVLFMDIVGYSKLATDRQTDDLQQLQDIVRATAEFVRAQGNNQLIRLPTGDGMALVFFGEPEAPLRCAMEVSRALKIHSGIMLRMGVNSGPVNQIVDVNDGANVAGAGINLAQRVMDCGDAGHILLSKRIADDLGQYSRWQPFLHDLGETTVKHDVRMHIVNFYNDEIGNPVLPLKFKKGKKPFPIVPVAAVLLVIVIAGALAVWRPWGRRETTANSPNTKTTAVTPVLERTFTYYLTPSDKGNRIEEERFTGNEKFHNGSKFRFLLIPEQAGALYLLDRSSAPHRTDSWYVLFPTPKNNGGSSQVNANERMEARISFDDNPGDENLSIIWSVRPIPELERIFAGAAKTGFEIKDQTQITTINMMLAKYGSPEPKAEVNSEKIQTTVKGGTDIFIRRLVLKHFEF